MRYEKDTIKHIEDSDLIQLSRNLLDSIVTSTDMLNPKNMTPERLAEAKIVLGYLNSSNNALKTKMQYFKMMGIGEKIKIVQKANKAFLKRK